MQSMCEYVSKVLIYIYTYHYMCAIFGALLYIYIYYPFTKACHGLHVVVLYQWFDSELSCDATCSEILANVNSYSASRDN